MGSGLASILRSSGHYPEQLASSPSRLGYRLAPQDEDAGNEGRSYHGEVKPKKRLLMP